MKKKFMAFVALFMAVLMVALSPVQALAASSKQYISEIRMANSVEKLEGLGYTVLEKDLNAGTSWYDITELKTRSEYSYIGYKTTTNPDEAITDISIMDMKGGYSFGDYEENLKRQEKEISESIGSLRDMLKEFAANYKAGSPAALKAYTALNNYIEDDSGKPVGDLFLEETLSDADLIKIYMQSNMTALYCLETAVTVGLANYNDDSILEKLSALGPVETETDYFDEAGALLDSLDVLKKMLSAHKSAGIDMQNTEEVQAYLDENSDEKTMDFAQNALLYNHLSAYEYGDSGKSLAEFFMSDEIEAEDLYPLISVMTKGQYAAAKLNGFLTLFASTENDSKIYDKAQQELLEESETNETVEPISIYTGTDRSMYEGGVAITSDVKRKSASTGDTSWACGNIDSSAEIALYITAGISALTALIFAGIGTFANYTTTILTAGLTASVVRSMLTYKILSAIFSNPITSWIYQSFLVKVNRINRFTLTAAGGIITFASIAILALTAIAYFSLEIYNYNNPKYTEIPLIMLDLKFGESDEFGDWEKYVRYDVVRDENKKAADLNCFMGKQWNAMYVTKDRSAGNPIEADSLTVQYGNQSAPRNCLFVHYFGSTDSYAMNLNTHCYNDEEGGIFMFFRSDDNAFASETASVFGSGTLSIVTGFGGLIIGALGAILITTKKKKENIAEA